MPSSAVRTFTDPDEYAGSSRATRAELTITARGHFAAKHTCINLHHLWMQRFSDNLPRIGHWANIAGDSVLSFRTQPGPSLLSDGAAMLETNIIRRTDAQDYFQQSAGHAYFGSLSMPIEQMALGAAMVGCDLTPPRHARTITPPPTAMAKLQRLHAVAGQLAEDAPAVIAHPDAARGLEQALIGAMFECLRAGEAAEDRSAVRQHAMIMRKFHAAMEERPDEAFYLPELCAAIGVSDRTLRVCCHEHLGMGPKRYLMLRRMRLVRQDLRESTPTTTTVTEIATRYGFWQFGRFAGEYKAIFGELPSERLARPGM
jgi:methylphosphotriester-DNA--protein-cysteine methyltransferase